MNTTTALLTAPDVDGISAPASGEGQSVHRRWLPSAMAQAGDVMTAPVALIDATASMWEAARRLFGSGETHLVVVDGTRPVGILNETVLALRWPCGPLSAYRQEVRHVTVGRVHSVLPQAAVSKVAEIMLDDAVDAVPVVTRRGVVVGLVTRRDLIELIARLPTPAGSRDRAEDRPATHEPDSLPNLAALPQGGKSCGTSLSARR
jgi:CBS domain-containing protein